MARVTSTNYTTPAAFTWGTASTDLFNQTDLENFAQAMEVHDHTAGKGLAVGRVTATGRLQQIQGLPVASANNLTLGTDGNAFTVNGNTQINLIDSTGWQSGSQMTLLFAGAPIVTNGTVASGTFLTIHLTGNVNYATSNSGTLVLQLMDGAWWEIGRKA